VQAVPSARAQQQREWEAWGLKLLGDIHAHELAKVDQAGIDQGGTEQAGEAYRRALALAIELGMRPLGAHCHFGLDKRYQQSNQRKQAREHFTTSTTIDREMDMRFWLEKAGVGFNEFGVR